MAGERNGRQSPLVHGVARIRPAVPSQPGSQASGLSIRARLMRNTLMNTYGGSEMRADHVGGRLIPRDELSPVAGLLQAQVGQAAGRGKEIVGSDPVARPPRETPERAIPRLTASASPARGRRMPRW